MVASILSGLVLLFQGAASGPPDVEVEAMKKLSHMAGKWEGTGWSMTPGGTGRHEFRGGETIQSKLHGRTLLVEGIFHRWDEAKKERGAVAHETLAIISFDPAKNEYRFQTHLFNGPPGEYKLELIEGGWRWQIERPGSPVVRFTCKMTETTWHEIGEVMLPGREPMTFLEMHLKKVGK